MTPAELQRARELVAKTWWRRTSGDLVEAVLLLKAALPVLEDVEAYGTVCQQIVDVDGRAAEARDRIGEHAIKLATPAVEVEPQT